jgi:hypothetical protein
MRELLLTLASPGTLSWIGFILLAGGLLGEVGVYVLSPKWEALHGGLVFAFAAIVLVGYVIGHIGDDESFRIVSARAKTAEAQLKEIASPRTITPEERAKFISCMKATSERGPVFIRPGIVNSDAPLIGEDLDKIFDEIGGFPKGLAWPGGPALSWAATGIFLVVIDLQHAPQHATNIQRCFWEAGRKIFGYADPKHPADAVSIGIGPRL